MASTGQEEAGPFLRAIGVADARRRAMAIEHFFQSLAAMVLNVVLRLVPTRVKAAIAATAINAAIKAYSMAVTPTRPGSDWKERCASGFSSG